MAFVKQKCRSDCGIAALAMLCDVDYATAKEAITWWKKYIYYTNTKQLRKAAIKLGYQTKSTPQNRLKVVLTPKSWAILAVPMPQDWWYLIPNNSLVKVTSPNGQWHWVVWRKNKIYDPARGVFHPGKHGATPRSYMQFIKEEGEDNV